MTDNKEFDGRMLSIRIGGHVFYLGHSTIKTGNNVVNIIIKTSTINNNEEKH